MGLHRKQNPLSWAVASLTDHTFIELIRFRRAVDHSTETYVVARTIIKQDFCKNVENSFFYWCQTAIESRSDT